MACGTATATSDSTVSPARNRPGEVVVRTQSARVGEHGRCWSADDRGGRLTAATMLMAVAALARLAPERIDGWILTGALALETIFPAWQARLAIGLILLAFATDLLLARRRQLLQMAAAVPQTMQPARRRPTAG